MFGGQNTKGHGHQHPHDNRDAGERGGGGKAGEEGLRHRLVGNEGVAKVAAPKLGEVMAEPLPEGIVEMVPGMDLADDFRRGLRAGDDPRHVAGHGVDEDEGQYGGAEERDAGPEESREQPGEHISRRSTFVRGARARPGAGGCRASADY